MLKNKIFAIFYLSLIITIFAGCGGGVDVGNPTYATGHISLAWDVPTTNMDGTPATGPVGFKVYYGTRSGEYTNFIDVKNATNYTVNSLFPGTYYLAVTAYDATGIESDYSTELVKTI